MIRISSSLLVLLFCICALAQEDIYRPTQHFVFPRVEVNIDSDGPESSQIIRGEHHDYIFNYAFSACYDS